MKLVSTPILFLQFLRILFFALVHVYLVVFTSSLVEMVF